ncbi:MAG TPA: hypothetical protein VLA66_03750 [Thermoanaerobaculia bacterium]|nr:hypothetical protein [Thermoanaerobaculia bacterium]
MTPEGEQDGQAREARRVVEATAVDGPRAGARLRVWPAGQCAGDLGWPRLNQRVALYAEQLLERRTTPASARKPFDVPSVGKVEIRFELIEEEGA